MDLKMNRFILAVVVMLSLGAEAWAKNLAAMSLAQNAADSSAANEDLIKARQSPAGIWISAAEIAALPVSGPAWDRLQAEADRPAGKPQLSNQDDEVNVQIMAKALVFARTRNERYRTEVIDACMAAIGTEKGGRTLALGRELVAYIIAADLVGLPSDADQRFRAWLRTLPAMRLDGKTLRSTHEERPNNWGTHAGASRVAIAAYLGDQTEIARCAQVFKGWLGDRASYAEFQFGDLFWQADPNKPVGINPKGASKVGCSIDGVLPDDQRRAGKFKWPPPKENYVYEALQGALVQAVILHRRGYDVWNWQDKALLRAFEWLHNQANFPASGDDSWQPHIINYYYRTKFPAPVPSLPGKNIGWTDWTHGSGKQGRTDVEAAESNFTPKGFALEQNYPNPVRVGARVTQIAFEVEQAGSVVLELFNAVGQKVHTLFAGLVQPGRHVISWNGASAEGARLPNGVYIYKLTVGKVSIAHRLILSK
jgi:hypothetical protein